MAGRQTAVHTQSREAAVNDGLVGQWSVVTLQQLFTCHTRRLTRNTCLSTWRDPCGSQWHARLQPVTRQPVLPARLCSLGSDYCSYAPVKYSYSLTRVLWKCGTVKWRNKFGVKPEGGKCGTGKCRTTAVEWPMVL